MGENSCKVIDANGSTMIELSNVTADEERLVVRGALMGAWETDMYMDVDSLKAAVGMVDFPAVMKFIADNVLQIKVTKVDE